LCELYAKLIGVVLNQWVFQVGLWPIPQRSLARAIRLLQKYALPLALAFSDFDQLLALLTRLVKNLATCCRLETRKLHPSTIQRLLAVEETQ
jgi:hypothetical protein